jgi:hypothetical protein
MSQLPFQFKESSDGTLEVEGYIQRAYNSRGVDGELYTQDDLKILSELILDNPAIGDHGKDPVCKANILGRVTQARIQGNDLLIRSVVAPPPATPEHLYNYARDQLRSGKWQAYSIRWFALNDPLTKKPNPDKRIPIEVSFCKEPHFGYARFTSVTASKHPTRKTDAVLTKVNAGSTLKSSVMEINKETVMSLLKAANPDLPETFLDTVPVEKYGEVLANGAKLAITQRNELKQKLEEGNKVAIGRREKKAATLLDSFKGLVDDTDSEAFAHYLTKDLPTSDKWPVVHRVLRRVADDRLRIDSMDAQAQPETTALAASKRVKSTAPDFDVETAVQAKKNPDDPSPFASLVAEAFSKY